MSLSREKLSSLHHCKHCHDCSSSVCALPPSHLSIQHQRFTCLDQNLSSPSCKPNVHFQPIPEASPPPCHFYHRSPVSPLYIQSHLNPETPFDESPNFGRQSLCNSSLSLLAHLHRESCPSTSAEAPIAPPPKEEDPAPEEEGEEATPKQSPPAPIDPGDKPPKPGEKLFENSSRKIDIALSPLHSARKMFDEMPQRDIVSWIELIVAHARNGDMNFTQNLFDEKPLRSLFNINFPLDPFGLEPNVALTEQGLVFMSEGCPMLQSALYFCRQISNANANAVKLETMQTLFSMALYFPAQALGAAGSATITIMEVIPSKYNHMMGGLI
ncbi:hypothetical protein SESBI_47565 [Sesbania bispinosa]|nr:hypothetical protein SESBI_47565 [Sesbania bispinosa]